jgi:hypothetical protein
MDFKAIDKAIIEIIRCRIELNQIDYSNPSYDELEEKLHDLEDDFQDNYGEQMEDVLQDVHDKHCPDSDVLLPIAYLANNYIITDKNEYSASPAEGVFVEMENHPGKDTKLLLLPNPLRILLSIGANEQKIVWAAK